MKREELRVMKLDDLRKMATRMGLKGNHKLHKADLIEQMLEKQGTAEEPQRAAGSSADEAEKKAEAKLELIDSVSLGQLVAFRLPNGKVKSAKMIKRQSKGKKLLVETAYGQQHTISYSDVLWVRTGERWPKGVYELLKGGCADGEKKTP